MVFRKLYCITTTTTTTLPDDWLFSVEPALNGFEKLPYNENIVAGACVCVGCCRKVGAQNDTRYRNIVTKLNRPERHLLVIYYILYW